MFCLTYVCTLGGVAYTGMCVDNATTPLASCVTCRCILANHSTDYVIRVHVLVLLPTHRLVPQHFMCHHKKAMLMWFVY